MSTLDHTLKLGATEVHRLEVITGTGRRRHFPEDFKAAIVAETLVADAVVSEVARRHGLTPQQLFTWRRQARQPVAVSAGAEGQQFVPAVVEAVVPGGLAAGRQRKKWTRRADQGSGIIEVAIEGMTVRIGHGAEAKTVVAVLRALKAGA